MIDFYATQVRGHRQNIERYCRLLATELTDLERQYLHKRIAEEHAQLERLQKKQGKREAAMAAEAAE
jgi:5-bromo-4-chloroindolyl phosphate hydrolysis protein